LSLEEFCEFETPVEQIDSLLFVGARMIDCLVSRAAGRALALTSLKAEMRLEGGGMHDVAIRPALPSTDRKFLLKLLQLEIGAHPPNASVVAITLRADAGQQSKVQLGLFTPQTPEPSRLDVTLARLRALVGEERVGSPVLEDTHRSGAFRMDGFSIEVSSSLAQAKLGWGTGDHKQRMALRRVRPARVVRVLVAPSAESKATINDVRVIPGPKIRTRGTRVSTLKPVSFRDGEHAYAIASAYGPWRNSGCWWAVDAWDMEEWDVLATANDGASIACLLTCDRSRNAWRLEAFYD
jgi:protein ImuB